jgi:AAA+ superfamily predicted ATPase
MIRYALGAYASLKNKTNFLAGTMFLTTNLWETIDPAMESRIQVHLQFPRLPSTSRAKIWENFLKRIPKEICDLNDSEVQKLGLWNLNGRDIKNALKMTAAWCRQNDKDSYMTFRRFEDVITITCPRATKDVEHKINGVNGAKEDSPLKNGVVSNFVTESHTGDMIDLL